MKLEMYGLGRSEVGRLENLGMEDLGAKGKEEW